MIDKIEKIVFKGPGLLETFLTVLFVALKLCNIINWTWWWVFSPLWIGCLITLTILIVLAICVALLN